MTYDLTSESVIVITNFKYKRELTINYSEKIISDLTNFPVLVNINTSRIGLSKSYCSGKDIKFFTDDTEETELNHELVYYDNETGNGEFWVSIPNISSSENTTFYMKYGKNNMIDTSKRTTWDSNFNYVGHMQIDGRDSSQHNFSVSNNGSPSFASGKIGGGMVANSGGLSISDTSMSSSSLPRTFECWAYLDNSEVTGDKYAIAYTGTGGPGDSYLMYSNSNPDKWKWLSKSRSPADSIAYGSEGTTQEWHHIVVVRYNSTNFVIYDNGVGIPTSDYSNSYDRYGYSGGPLAIGHLQSGYRFLGMLDEARTSNIGRSEAWIKATYYTSADLLITYGDEIITPDGYSEEINSQSYIKKIISNDTTSLSVITKKQNMNMYSNALIVLPEYQQTLNSNSVISIPNIGGIFFNGFNEIMSLPEFKKLITYRKFDLDYDNITGDIDKSSYTDYLINASLYIYEITYKNIKTGSLQTADGELFLKSRINMDAEGDAIYPEFRPKINDNIYWLGKWYRIAEIEFNKIGFTEIYCTCKIKNVNNLFPDFKWNKHYHITPNLFEYGGWS